MQVHAIAECFGTIKLKCDMNSNACIRDDEGAYRERYPLRRFVEMARVAAFHPKAVICLVSALELHGVIREIRSEKIWIALPNKARVSTEFPPNVQIVRFSALALESGKKSVLVRGHGHVPVFTPAKTIVDCFKFRNTLAREVQLELPELIGLLQKMVGAYRRNPLVSIDAIRQYLPVCRMSNVMAPYLAALDNQLLEKD